MTALKSLLWFPVCIINAPDFFCAEDDVNLGNNLLCYYPIQTKPDSAFNNNNNNNENKTAEKIVAKKKVLTDEALEEVHLVKVVTQSCKSDNDNSCTNGENSDEREISQFESVSSRLPNYALNNFSIQYFQLGDSAPQLAKLTGNTAHNLCIEWAIKIVEYYAEINSINATKECETEFSKLMLAALNYSNHNANVFVTSLLINLGLFKDEDGKFRRNGFSEVFMNNLAVWLINFNSPKPKVTRNILGYLQFAFDNVRPNFEAKISKLRTLVEYVLLKRQNYHFESCLYS